MEREAGDDCRECGAREGIGVVKAQRAYKSYSQNTNKDEFPKRPQTKCVYLFAISRRFVRECGAWILLVASGRSKCCHREPCCFRCVATMLCCAMGKYESRARTAATTMAKKHIKHKMKPKWQRTAAHGDDGNGNGNGASEQKKNCTKFACF